MKVSLVDRDSAGISAVLPWAPPGAGFWNHRLYPCTREEKPAEKAHEIDQIVLVLEAKHVLVLFYLIYKAGLLEGGERPKEENRLL